MIYDFACHSCKVVTQVERPISEAGEPATCEWCSNAMRRIFYAPRLLNRQKPGSFRFDPCRMDANDDRLASTRQVEEKQGAAGLRKLFHDVGPQYYQEILDHKKERYAS
jgi:putative FmdB family regulatory protein